MRGLSIAAAVVVACGIAAVSWVKSSTFSPTPMEPLGKHELVEAWLKEQDFALAHEQDDDQSDAPSDGPVTQRFEHHFRESLANSSEVALTQDADKSLRGIVCRFWSGKDVVRHPGVNGPHAEIFAFTLWKDLAGELPEFETKLDGSGRLARQVLVAHFDEGGARGTWLKTYDTNGDVRTLWDTVTFERR